MIYLLRRTQAAPWSLWNAHLPSPRSSLHGYMYVPITTSIPRPRPTASSIRTAWSDGSLFRGHVRPVGPELHALPSRCAVHPCLFPLPFLLTQVPAPSTFFFFFFFLPDWIACLCPFRQDSLLQDLPAPARAACLLRHQGPAACAFRALSPAFRLFTSMLPIFPPLLW